VAAYDSSETGAVLRSSNWVGNCEICGYMTAVACAKCVQS